MKTVRTTMMQVNGVEVPVTRSRSRKEFIIAGADEEWVRTENRLHAAVLLEMMGNQLRDT